MKNKYGQDKLIPLGMYQRQQEQEKKKQEQLSNMNSRRLKNYENAYNRSVDSSRDKYMIDAYKKVRLNHDISFEQSLVSFNGSYIHNGKIKPS